MSVDRPIPREDIALLLSSALGDEKSDEVILAVARDLGLPAGQAYSADELRAMFERLSTLDGLVGVVARFAISRGDVEKVAARSRASCEPRAASRRTPAVDLVPLLAPAIGVEKAREALETGASRLGLDAKTLTNQGALDVLDLLAKTEGIVGVVARFAKARYLLSSSSEASA